MLMLFLYLCPCFASLQELLHYDYRQLDVYICISLTVADSVLAHLARLYAQVCRHASLAQYTYLAHTW